jgi:CubicO group peptidase (beta-lactamase class C family)
MRRLLTGLSLLFSVNILFLFFHTHGFSQQTDTAALSSRVDAFFERWNKGNLPGAAVGVIQNGKVLHMKGYGLSNIKAKTPITAETVFDLASVSKQFTSFGAMILAERGKLSYDDPLSKYFPEFPPYAQKITIRHLMQHTSGLPDYEAALLKEGKIDKEYPRVTKRQGWDYEPTAMDALQILTREPVLRFPPGEEWEYSNSGYMVLAQIVAKASGERFADFMRQNVFEPLGMHHTLVADETKPTVKNKAASYSQVDGHFENLDYTPVNYIYGDGSVNSNIEDMLKWLQALDEHRLVKEETLKTAWTSGVLNLGASTGYGFGWYTGRTLGLSKISHTGSWAGFRNCMVLYPEQHFGIVILSNNSEIDYNERSDVTFKIARLYLENQMEMPKNVNLDRNSLNRFTGHYETESGDSIDVKFKEDALWAYPSGETPRKLIPESPIKFYIDGLEDDRFLFHEGDAGKVTGVTRRQNFWGFNSTAFNDLRKVK